MHGAETTLLAVLLGVLHMGEVGVNGATNELSAKSFELASFVAELANLSWANKGEVKGPEEEHNVLSYRNKDGEWIVCV